MKAGDRAHGTDLAGEDHAVGVLSNVERLLADRVTREPQLAFPPVPQRQPVHGVELVQRGLDTVEGDELEQHLGVAGAPEPHPTRLEPRAQVAVAVHLTVEGDDPPIVGGDHRLRAGRRQVDDREPPVAESDSGLVIGPPALPVGPAVSQRCQHSGQLVGELGRRGPLSDEQPRDPAHSRGAYGRARRPAARAS